MLLCLCLFLLACFESLLWYTTEWLLVEPLESIDREPNTSWTINFGDYKWYMEVIFRTAMPIFSRWLIQLMIMSS